MNKTTLILLLGALCAPLSSHAAAELSPEERTQQWVSNYQDAFGGTMLWNASRDVAAVYSNIGASHYHYVFWCLRREASGHMVPFACYSVRSDVLTPHEVALTPTGLKLWLRTGGESELVYEFPFSQKRASLELWTDKAHMDIPEYGEGTPSRVELERMNGERGSSR